MRTSFFPALLALAACRQPVERTFSYSTDAPSRAGLLSTPRGVIAANDFGTVALLDPTGHAAWRVSACREVIARPALAGEVVVVACSAGDWVGLNLSDGTERWRSKAGSSFQTPLASDGDRAFGVDQDAAVWAFEAATGASVWRRPGGELRPSKERRAFAAPVVWEGLLVASLAEAGLHAFDAGRGSLRWRLPTRGLSGLLPEADRLFVLWPSGKIGALRKDASWIWTREIGTPALSGPTLAFGLLWISVEGNLLIGLSTEDGAERARFNLPAPATGRIAELNGLLVAPTTGLEGRLVAFRLGQAHYAFSARTDSPLRTDALVLDGQVVVAPTDGRVLGFRPRLPQ
jgi:outer membrane protein assembly factor BamB